MVGVTGLYSHKYEEPNIVWFGWFCVDPECRGKGLGKQLLDWITERAKSLGYKKLRLYTSTAPAEAAAQALYEKVGLKTIPLSLKDFPSGLIGASEETIFREKELS